MGIDQHAKHAQRPVIFDKAHSTHVTRQVVDPLSVLGRLPAGGQFFQVEDKVFDVGKLLVPPVKRFNVHSSDARMALFKQVGDEVSADESACSADYDKTIFHNSP